MQGQFRFLETHQRWGTRMAEDRDQTEETHRPFREPCRRYRIVQASLMQIKLCGSSLDLDREILSRAVELPEQLDDARLKTTVLQVVQHESEVAGILLE